MASQHNMPRHRSQAEVDTSTAAAAGTCQHVGIDKKRKEKTTPFGVNLMRSQVLYLLTMQVGTLSCCGAGQ